MAHHDAGVSVPLSPIGFLERAGDVYPDKPATTGPEGSLTYAELRTEARAIAGRLKSNGLHSGDRIAVLSRNSELSLAMHFAVPGAGGVLVALNTRLSPREYSFILKDSGARLLFVEMGLLQQIKSVSTEIECDIVMLPNASGPGAPDQPVPSGAMVYAEWLGNDDDVEKLASPSDELEPISINYTSGTTGQPKGAIYTHRGAFLNAMGVALEFGLNPSSVYLWTLPMFHCNGWCFTWAATAVGATHVPVADFDADLVLDLIGQLEVSHLCGAPVVLDAIAMAGSRAGLAFSHDVRIATGGAPPSPATIGRMQEVGIDVIHLYGLTETYGPSVVCELQPDWVDLDATSYAERLSRQGVRTINVEEVRVVGEDGADVPADSQTIGEILIRSATVVDGYHNRPEETGEAFIDGWFRTGDLAVVHADGYLEVRDRRKDIIISGGENVSSVEVENVLMSHPAVLEAAVVGVRHPRWGEVPVAFVGVQPGEEVGEAELAGFVRERLAHFKAPKAVFFEALPKTSTGKIQKFELRQRARQLHGAGELPWDA